MTSVLRDTQDKFEQDLVSVFGERVDDFGPKLREMLFELWLKGTQNPTSIQTSSPVQESLDPYPNQVFVPSPPQSKSLGDLELRIMRLEAQQPPANLNGWQVCPAVMDVLSGQIFGVEHGQRLLPKTHQAMFELCGELGKFNCPPGVQVPTLGRRDFPHLQVLQNGVLLLPLDFVVITGYVNGQECVVQISLDPSLLDTYTSVLEVRWSTVEAVW